MKQFDIKFSIEIKAPINMVWEALTKPDLIKQYFFGTNVDTDWKQGSPIFFRGQWEGKSYEDKGKILEVIPEKHVAYTYWSSFSGMPDVPENYKTVVYELKKNGDHTTLTLTQDNNADENTKQHSEKLWKLAFEGLKKLVEKD